MHKEGKKTIAPHLFSLYDIDKITLKKQLLLKMNNTTDRSEMFFRMSVLRMHLIPGH